MDEEVTPTLNVPKDFEIEQYKKIIRERFANSQAPYKTTQVANDGSQKLPQRLLTTATELIQQGHYPATIALIIAAWFRFLEGEDSEGRILAVNDPLANQLTPLARMHRHDEKMQVDLLIKTSGIFSDALVTHPQFKNDVAHWLAEIHNHGTAETIKSFLNRHQVQ